MRLIFLCYRTKIRFYCTFALIQAGIEVNKSSLHTSSVITQLQRQELLLRMEYEYEKETFKQQTEAMGIGRKIKRGMCWYPLSVGRSYYNSLNQLVVEVERREDKDIEHVFEFGRPVCFFTQDASERLHYFNFTASVNYVDEDRMVVILPGASALMDIQNADRLGVQLYFDETSYRLMFEALGQVIKAKGNRLAELRDISMVLKRRPPSALPQPVSHGSIRLRKKLSTRSCMPRMWLSYTALREPARQPHW